MKPIEIWGPSTGSSRITIERDLHNHIKIVAMTDFGQVNTVFRDEQARKIRDALNEVLGE